MARKAALMASMTVLAVAVALFAAEAAVRYRDALRAPGSTSFRYYRHRRLQRAFVRDAEYAGVAHINRHGFRGPEFAARKSPGTTRIMAVGASTTFDPCAQKDSDTWPARLQHWLGTLAPGRTFEVINAGVPGYSMLDNSIRLETELYAFAPDIVILYAGHGVVSRNNLTRSGPAAGNTPDAMPVVTPWGDWLPRHSLLYGKMALWLEAPGGGENEAVDERQWGEAVANASDDFRRDLVFFVLIAKSLGANVVLLPLAHVNGSLPASQLSASDQAMWTEAFGAPAGVILEGYQRFNATYRAVADSLGVTFIPTSTFGITGHERYCGRDPIHFNGTGAEMMGRQLAESLLATDVLAPRKR